MTYVEELYLDGLAEARFGKKSYDIDVRRMAEAQRPGKSEAEDRYTTKECAQWAAEAGEGDGEYELYAIATTKERKGAGKANRST